MIWDEAKHKRFKGRFASMGLSLQTLRDKHKVRVHDGGGVYHHSGGMPEHLGSIRQGAKGFHATVNSEGSHPVSSVPFKSKAEAAAAISMQHPAVTSLSMNDGLQSGQVVSVSGWGLARVDSVNDKGVIIRRVVSGPGGKSRVEKKRVTPFEVEPYNGSLEQWNGDPDKHKGKG